MEHTNTAMSGDDSEAGTRFALSEQQVNFFRSFGFLHIPKLFTPDEIACIEAGFEKVFEGHQDPGRDDVMYIKESPLHTNARLHDDPHRYIIQDFLGRDENVSWLQNDPRMQAVARALVGENYEPASSEGSLFHCETSWHPDFYKATMDQFHIKASLYLEPLREHSGAIRVLPGSHFHKETYNQKLRWMMFKEADDIEAFFGVPADKLPSYTVDSDPGDLVVWDYRIIHASFMGGPRRRLLSINFREQEACAQ